MTKFLHPGISREYTCAWGRQALAVQRVRLCERGLALVDRFGERGIALAIGLDRYQRILDLAQRVEERGAIFGHARLGNGLGRSDFGAAASAVTVAGECMESSSIASLTLYILANSPASSLCFCSKCRQRASELSPIKT